MSRIAGSCNVTCQRLLLFYHRPFPQSPPADAFLNLLRTVIERAAAIPPSPCKFVAVATVPPPVQPRDACIGRRRRCSLAEINIGQTYVRRRPLAFRVRMDLVPYEDGPQEKNDSRQTGQGSLWTRPHAVHDLRDAFLQRSNAVEVQRSRRGLLRTWKNITKCRIALRWWSADVRVCGGCDGALRGGRTKDRGGR